MLDVVNENRHTGRSGSETTESGSLKPQGCGLRNSIYAHAYSLKVPRGSLMTTWKTAW